MRALGLGSVVLGFAVVLMSWDASRRFTHGQLKPQLPSFEIGSTQANLSAMPAQANLARETEASKPGGGGSDLAAAGSAKPAAHPSTEPAQPASTAKRLAESPDLPVRQFTPGSKAHVEAIVTAIDSEESRNSVAPLARLYFAFFDRAADYEGLNYYIDERHGGSSLEAIADEFAGSDEFRIRYGSLDNAAFFDRVYRNIFDAVPDATQRASWIAQLDAGMSRGQLMVAFSESGAFQAATSNEVFVTMAYAEALRREPDPAGFARWVRFLDAGNPREAVIAGLLAGARTTR